MKPALDVGTRDRPRVEHAPDVAVRVEAPARLHLGFIDPSATLGRRYGSLGVAIDSLATQLHLSGSSDDSFSSGETASAALVSRMREHIATLRQATGRHSPLRVALEATPPAHAGFGSGTQLALAIGRAFAAANGLDISTTTLAEMLARGARSGVGVAAFDHGGFILDGGPGAHGNVAPLISRLEFPADWRIVLAIDVRQSGLHGKAEASAIANLPSFDKALAANIAHETLMRMLPALADREFEPFADSLTRIQQSLGDYFAPAQGGSMFTSDDVGRFLGWVQRHFRAGIGQSSWGPTGFAFVASADVADCIVDEARAAHVVTDHLQLRVVRGRNRGAVVTTTPAAA